MARARTHLRILFPLEGGAHFHYYRSVAEAFSKRGHSLSVIFAKGMGDEEMEPVKRFAAVWPTFRYGRALYRADGWRKKFLLSIRNVLAYRRYAVFTDRPQYYQDRLIGFLPKWLKFLARRHVWGVHALIRTRAAERFLRACEARIAPDAEIVAHLREEAPDVLLVPSANLVSSAPDTEYLKAARALGIKSALAVMSWDALEKKGVINILPDRFLVWNEIKAEVAIREHEVPKDHIRITGAAQFDEWFTPHAPREDRVAFAARNGLKADFPILLYLCSSADIAGDERWLVTRLREAFDQSEDSRVRGTQILVRPHPLNAQHYKDFSLPGIAFGSRTGALPDRKETFQAFYDELSYSIATAGINTSAMLEGLIAGKPGITLFPERYRASQQEAPYFKQVIQARALYLARNEVHAGKLVGELIRGRDPLKGTREAFVASYIRPRGIARAAGEAIADEVESLAAEKR